MADGMHATVDRKVVDRLSRLFAGPPGARLDPGQLADLRRLNPDAPTQAAYWWIVATVLEGALPADGEVDARRDAERRWAVALNGMAILAGLYRRNHRLGAALSDAGYAEMRLQRLLSCPDDRLAVEVQTAARFLAAKGVAVDYFDLARLAVITDPEQAEDARRGIARDYFRTQYKTRPTAEAEA